jgi:hypothetical protein
MALKPEISIGAGLALATLVYSIYSNATPPIGDIRTLPENNDAVDKSERSASWLAAGSVAGVSLIARDPVIFMVGGSMVIAMAWWTRHANMVNPDVGAYRPGQVESPPMADNTVETYTPFQSQFAA